MTRKVSVGLGFSLSDPAGVYPARLGAWKVEVPFKAVLQSWYEKEIPAREQW